VGPFEVVEKKGPLDYQLALPDSLRHIHDVFHVSLLHHYISDPLHVIYMSSLQVSNGGDLIAELIFILDNRTRQLRHQFFNQVKVEWDSYSPHSAYLEDAHVIINKKEFFN
jgi:hypothetical protein